MESVDGGHCVKEAVDQFQVQRMEQGKKEASISVLRGTKCLSIRIPKTFFSSISFLCLPSELKLG